MKTTAEPDHSVKNGDISVANKIRGFSRDNVWDYENAFYWFSHPTRIYKLLAHFELYRSVMHLPGDIFELGVYKGASLVRLATFRSLLENDFSRKIVGFDAFGKFPIERLSLKTDIDFIQQFSEEGGDGLSQDEVRTILMSKNFQNVTLLGGNVFETLTKYLGDFPATRISFLHLDMDVKEPTIFALEQLWDRVVPGGIVVFDDYNSVAGETDAVDEFLKKKTIGIEKLSHTYAPSFVRKPI